MYNILNAGSVNGTLLSFFHTVRNSSLLKIPVSADLLYFISIVDYNPYCAT